MLGAIVFCSRSSDETRKRIVLRVQIMDPKNLSQKAK